MPLPNPNSTDFFDKRFFSDSKAKEVYKQLRSEQESFVNPLEKSIDSIFTTINNEIVPQLEEWEAIITGVPPEGFTQADITAIKTNIQDNFIPAQERFKTHTNLITGRTNTIEADIPNLRSIISVGSSSVALDNTLNEVLDNPCGNLMAAFSSIFLGTDTYLEAISFYQELIGSMNNGQATAAQINGRIEAYTNRLDELIQIDTDHFNSMVNDLLYASLAQTLPNWLNDPCGRFILEKTIGSKNLLDIL